MAGPSTDSSINPFETPTDMTDVVLEVEGSKVHFSKTLLMMSSPVFARMFTSDFRERNRRGEPIPLPEKTKREFVLFLKQLHPAFSWIPIEESDLEVLLALADEYDVQHVKDKCETLIRDRIKFSVDKDTALHLLWLTKNYNLTSLGLHDPLMTLAADCPIEQLERSFGYQRFDMPTQMELLRTHSKLLEKQAKGNHIELVGRIIRKLKEVVHRLPDMALPLKEKCSVVCLSCAQRGYRSIMCTSEPQCLGACWDSSHNKDVPSVQMSYCNGCLSTKITTLLGGLPRIWQKLNLSESNVISFD